MSKDLIVKEQFSPKDLELIKSTIAKNATNEELSLFLYRAKAMGLNPLKPGQIYFMKFGQSAGTIVIGLDGFRALAAKTGKHRGTRRGVTKNDKGELVGGWAEVSREGWAHAARADVAIAEFKKNTPVWREQPENMIQKVAECAALRMAFPDELGGVYGEDERIVSEPVSVTPRVETMQVENLVDRPEFEAVIEAPAQIVQDHDYIFKTGGSRKGKKVSDFTIERLNKFIEDVAKMANVPDEVMLDYNAVMEYLEETGVVREV